MINKVRVLFTITCLLLATGSLQLLSNGPQAQTIRSGDADSIYVSASAEIGGNGTSASPFRMLSDAERASEPGDTIFLIAQNITDVIDGHISLKPGQKLLGMLPDGRVSEDVELRVKLTNSSTQNDGFVVEVSNSNEIAGVHFVNIRNSAITNEKMDFSNTHIHHSTFSGTADDHVEDDRGLLYAVTFSASEGVQGNVRVEDSLFLNGFDLGAIYISHSGSSKADYRFQRNEFYDLGGRPYFVQTSGQSKVETVILDSSADNIGLGGRNSDSIIPWLMGESEQVMLVQNYHYKNTDQVGNDSNTGMEAFIFGEPRPDPENWCIRCKLSLKIVDSVFEDTVTDSIQFTNFGVNSDLSYEIRNTRIVGGDPKQGGGAISLNVENGPNSSGRTTLLVENTDIFDSKGYGFSMNDSGVSDGYSATIDFGGGALGSRGNNRIVGNERGSIRIPPVNMSAGSNWWGERGLSVRNTVHELYPGANIEIQPLLAQDPR